MDSLLLQINSPSLNLLYNIHMSKRIQNEVINTIEIERSRFICYLNRCFNEQQCRDYIAHIRKLHPDATHHCTAFICDGKNIQRTNDDGEPSKTAGKPMIEVLLKNDMVDICAVVVRYFGGIKLGAGGLIRAYGKSVSEALAVACLVESQMMDIYSLDFDYSYIDKIEYLLKDIEILSKDYQESVTYTYMNKDLSLHKIIQETTKGRYLPTLIDTIEIEVAIPCLKEDNK